MPASFAMVFMFRMVPDRAAGIRNLEVAIPWP
jgi:hypothetical protein